MFYAAFDSSVLAVPRCQQYPASGQGRLHFPVAAPRLPPKVARLRRAFELSPSSPQTTPSAKLRVIKIDMTPQGLKFTYSLLPA